MLPQTYLSAVRNDVDVGFSELFLLKKSTAFDGVRVDVLKFRKNVNVHCELSLEKHGERA